MPTAIADRMNQLMETFCFDSTLMPAISMLLRGENPKQALALLLTRARAAKIALFLDPDSSWDKMTDDLVNEYILFRELPASGNCTVCVLGSDSKWHLFGEEGWPLNTTEYSREEAIEVLKEMPIQRVRA